MALHEADTLSALDPLLSTNTFVVVDFWASWCPPCRAVAPSFKKWAAEYTVPGQLVFAKTNVDVVPDAHPDPVSAAAGMKPPNDVAAKYGISSMPTFLFFTSGSVGVAVKPPFDSPLFQKGEEGKEGEEGTVKSMRGINPPGIKALEGVIKELHRIAKEKAAASGVEEEKKEGEEEVAADAS